MTDIDCPDRGGIHARNSGDCPGDREAADEEERQARREAQAGAEPDALSSRGWALWREPGIGTTTGRRCFASSASSISFLDETAGMIGPAITTYRVALSDARADVKAASAQLGRLPS